jgi:hypothetical protein
MGKQMWNIYPHYSGSSAGVVASFIPATLIPQNSGERVRVRKREERAAVVLTVDRYRLSQIHRAVETLPRRAPWWVRVYTLLLHTLLQESKGSPVCAVTH